MAADPANKTSTVDAPTPSSSDATRQEYERKRWLLGIAVTGSLVLVGAALAWMLYRTGERPVGRPNSVARNSSGIEMPSSISPPPKEEQWRNIFDARKFRVTDRASALLSKKNSASGSAEQVEVLKLLDFRSDDSPELVLGVQAYGASAADLTVWVLSMNGQRPRVDFRETIRQSGALSVKGKQIILTSDQYAEGDAGCCPSGERKEIIGAKGAKIRVLSRSITFTATPPAPPQPIPGRELDGSVWGVYVAVGRQGSAELQTAISRMEDLGFTQYDEFSYGGIACDHGAPEALGVSRYLFTVALYFRTPDEAERFADSLTPPPLGVAQVGIGCND